jgi:hypothetical protein
VVAERSGAQSIPNSTFTAVNYTTTIKDDLNLLSTNTIEIPQDGEYSFDAFAEFAAAAGGSRISAWHVNGTEVRTTRTRILPTGSEDALHSSYTDTFTKGQLVSFQVWQNSGGALNINRAHIGMRKNPDYTVLGAVRNSEYLETEITSDTIFGTAQTDVVGSEITLTPGEWLVGYSVPLYFDQNTTSITLITAVIRLTDSSNNQIPGGTSSILNRGDNNAFDNTKWVFQQTKVVITETTTFKLRGSRNGTLSDADLFIFGSSASSDAKVWANRIK